MIINIMIKMTDVDTDPLPIISSSPSAIKMRGPKPCNCHPNIPIHKAEILKGEAKCQGVSGLTGATMLLLPPPLLSVITKLSHGLFSSLVDTLSSEQQYTDG